MTILANQKALADAAKAANNVIGILINNWRGRMVTVYETADPALVLTIGDPLDGNGEVVECIESRVDWLRTISLYPEHAVYD